MNNDSPEDINRIANLMKKNETNFKEFCEKYKNSLKLTPQEVDY